MTLDEYDAFCRSLPATTYVVQWRGAHVWKVGGKVFAIGHGHDDQASVTFKVSDVAYEMLQGETGLRPAPHLASRGLKLIQLFASNRSHSPCSGQCMRLTPARARTAASAFGEANRSRVFAGRNPGVGGRDRRSGAG